VGSFGIFLFFFFLDCSPPIEQREVERYFFRPRSFEGGPKDERRVRSPVRERGLTALRK